MIVIDHLNWSEKTTPQAVAALVNFVKGGGTIVLGAPETDTDLIKSLDQTLCANSYSLETVEYLSETCEFDTYPVHWASHDQ